MASIFTIGARSALALVGTIVLAGCGGVAGLSGPNSMCNTGTQEQLANPLSNQTGVSTTIGQITIVANSNTNQLYNTYAQWQINLTDTFGGLVNGQPLRLVPYPNGPHPYASDFYYASSIGNLQTGHTYNAYLSMSNGSCMPVPLGQFST